MSELAEYAAVCQSAVRAGGAVLLDWIGRVEIREKAPADLVTQADFASQEIVRKTIAEAFPGHCLLAEEDHPAPAAPAKAEFRWILDPLDGTTNYVHQVPHYSVSLALEHQGRLLTAAVYDPVLEECFTATAGQGALLGGQSIHTSNIRRLSEALAAVGFPAGAAGRHSPDLAVFLEAMTRCQAIRRTGSSALNLCYLAAGRFDVYWSFSTKVWDVAAGVLILLEAGGAVTAPDGGPFRLDQALFVAAANQPLHAQLLDLVRQAGQ